MAGQLNQLRAVSDPTGLLAGVQFSGYINNRTLAASTAEADTPPAGAKAVIITFDVDGWVNPNGGNAAVPSGDATDGSGSIFCVAGVPRLFGLDNANGSLSLIAAAIAHASLEYFA